MVVVTLGDSVDDGGGVQVEGGAPPPPTLQHFPSQYTQQYPAHVGKYPPPGGYDSDSNSDHSSSGRGSGGSDLGSEVDRDGSRLEDSGRYSADGCDASATLSSSEVILKPSLTLPVPPVPTLAPQPARMPPRPRSLSANRCRSSAEGLRQARRDAIASSVVSPTRPTPRRSAPVTHPPVDSPLCGQCARRDLSFFDPGCSGCSALLRRPTTTPAHVFAVMRQWVPQVQQNIHHFVQLILNMGCHVDDRDALTDMTLLHYAVKSGSVGVGDPATALQVVKELLRDGADVHQRCRWTHMTALHYAAYFDVAPVLDLLLRDPKGVCINDACLEYSGGTPLHIAAANLSLSATRVLLQHGALPTLTDTQGRTPFQCIPAPDQYELVPDVQDVIGRLRALLSPTGTHAHTSAHAHSYAHTNSQGSSGRAVLKAMGLKLGDRVLVSGVKTGTLRFVGATEFATGLWAGVELETQSGRHNGTVKGVMYFRCANNYGVFVPVNRLTKIPNVSGGGRQGRSTSVAHRQQRSPRVGGGAHPSRRSASLPPGRVNHGRVDVSRVASRVAQDIRNTTRKIVVGDRVYVDMGVGSGSSQRAVTGVVRYTGAVHFASGFWVGVELDLSRGTNDGSVNGTRYFACRSQHGIFAAPSRVIKISSDPDAEDVAADMRHSRYSLSSTHGSTHAINTSCSGSLSLGYCPPPPSFAGSGPISLGTSMGSSSSAVLGTSVDDPYDECAHLPPASHLLDDQAQGALARTHSLKTAIYPSTTMTSLNRSFSARYVSSRQRQEEIERAAEERKKEQTWCDPPVLPGPKNPKKKTEDQHWLEVGHNVFYKNEVGVIKYIGRVDFEAGVWLGVELRAAKGRHDGVVRGRRYFSCRPRHGIMVRPSKVYVRGINGARLVKPEEELEE
ncbi:CAP-Gly domain-containing linker protein 3-like [Penaeus monodon]|uniref:CAP-Gly domain-containing linker protein 3-like n=1 Tax=Penaeus monodon TaxID=6687 RepID=UPI0018A75AF6|nr:CAP-Gly domain-containing linker protein 3-like [Penaeus monodon]